MPRILFNALIAAFLLSACNLAQAPTEEPFTSATATNPTPVHTSTSTPTATQAVTATAELPLTGCIPRSDWPTYTVQPGDTLFNIVQLSRAGYSVDELAQANCLDDPNNLAVGQVIYVPNAIRTGELLVYWASVPADAISDDSVVVACDAVISPIASTVAEVSDDPALNTRNRLNLLFSATVAHGGGWSGHGLTVTSMTIDDSGHAEIAIGGEFLFPGHCGDGRLEAELLFTIFEEPAINSVRVIVTGRNLGQIIDLSGRTGPDYVYTRDYLPPDRR